MENLIIAVIILSVIIIFVSVNSVIICNTCDEMIALIDEGKIENAVILWEKRQEYLSIFIRDAEVDCVNAEIEGFCGEYALEDGEAENKRLSLRSAIEEIKNSEHPCFDNIL